MCPLCLGTAIVTTAGAASGAGGAAVILRVVRRLAARAGRVAGEQGARSLLPAWRARAATRK